MFRRDLLKRAGLFAALGTAGWGRPAAAAGAPAGAYDWQSVPFGAGGFIDGFVFHPRVPGLLYARTDIGGAYRFDPATASWLPLLDHLSRADADLMGVLSLAVDPHAPDRLYAACGLYLDAWQRNGAVLRSDDRGATWQATELGIKLGGNSPGRGSGERLQVDPNDGSVLFLGTSQDGLLKSADRGLSFKPLNFAPRHASLVLFDERSGSAGTGSRTIYVGSHDQPGLYVSHDGGASFAREPGTPAQAPQRAAFAADGTLYVTFAIGDGNAACNPGARAGSVWKRSPDGHWTDITPLKPGTGKPGFGYSGLGVDAKRPGRLIVSTIERWTEGDDLLLSTDGGASWQPLSAHSQHDTQAYPWLVNYVEHLGHPMGHWISDLKIDPFDGNRAIYGTGYGLWLTHNLGDALENKTVNWNFTVANFEETATLEIRSPSGGATLLGAMGDVSGAAWDDLRHTPKTGLFVPSCETNRSVDFAQLKPAILARTCDQAATGGYWSANGGASWQPFGSRPGLPYRRSGDIAVSAQGAALVTVPEGQGAFFSHDLGKTWQASAGWPQGGNQALKPVADRTVDGVFYAHDRANGQILVSVDGGRSFKPGITGLPKLQFWQTAHLICAPGTIRDLWLALPDGLLHLPGLDQPTRTVRDVAEAWMVAVGKAAPKAPYHSVYVWGRVNVDDEISEGLFRSDDAGASFRRINDDRHRYGRLLSMTADPLEHGTLYLAPHGRGVIVGRPRAGA
jgi:photosystem II stability/assembly factor-like uncharacterized protein